jgi:hypothetical protein
MLPHGGIAEGGGMRRAVGGPARRVTVGARDRERRQRRAEDEHGHDGRASQPAERGSMSGDDRHTAKVGTTAPAD